MLMIVSPIDDPLRSLLTFLKKSLHVVQTAVGVTLPFTEGGVEWRSSNSFFLSFDVSEVLDWIF